MRFSIQREALLQALAAGRRCRRTPPDTAGPGESPGQCRFGRRRADRHGSGSRDGRAHRSGRSGPGRGHRAGAQALRHRAVHCPMASRSSSSNPANARCVSAGRSRFTLATLPATEFPVIENIELIERVSLPEATLKSLMERTSFAMAHQDVRYYLNGMLLDLRETFAALRRDRRPSAGAGGNQARQPDHDEPPDHRSAQGRHRAAGPVRSRRRQGRARVRAQSSARASRRRHVHLEADRRPFPGLRGRHSDRRRQGSAREPR